MINRLKAQFLVYQHAIKLAFTISFLLLLGIGCGFALGRMDASQRVKHLDEMHSLEISRIQTSNQQVIMYLTTRMQELIEEQARLASLVSEGVREARGYARSAADSSKGAVVDGPKSKIKITEIPPDTPTVDDKHQFPERIEH